MNVEKTEVRSQEPEGMTGEELLVARAVRSTVGVGLDRQRGRAGAAFLLGIQNSEFRMQSGGTLARDGRWLKLWAGAASALAACLAVVVGLQVWMRPAGDGRRIENGAIGQSVPVMDEVVYSRDLDGGTVVIEDLPMRVVRQQTVRQREWFDANERATYRVVEPVERVGYVRVQPY